MKKRILCGVLAFDGIFLLVIVALFLADHVSGVPCGQRPYITLPYLGCSRYAEVALVLMGILLDSMIVTVPLLLFALIQEVEAALRRLVRTRSTRRPGT